MRRIVLIDDSAVVLKATAEALTAAGFQVVALSEPSRAAFDPNIPLDLVLCDVVLVHAFGDDAARFLRTSWGVTAPIYLYSTLPEEELRLRAGTAGAAGYICKSWGLERLVAEVHQILSATPALPFAETRQMEALPPTHRPAAATSAGVYAIFVRESAAHAEAIVAAIDGAHDDAALLAVAAQELHAWIGDARILQLDPLGAPLHALQDRVRAWQKGFSREANAEHLRRWVERLGWLSEQVTLGSPRLSVGRELRALCAEIEAGTPPPAPPEGAPPPATGRRVLFFDDSQIIGEVLKQELEPKGHSLTLAHSLAEFEARLAEEVPEIVLLDVNMPEVTGDDVCRQLRARYPESTLCVLLFSSIGDEELARIARDAGADGFISKQRGMDEIVPYLDWLFAQKR